MRFFMEIEFEMSQIYGGIHVKALKDPFDTNRKIYTYFDQECTQECCLFLLLENLVYIQPDNLL